MQVNESYTIVNNNIKGKNPWLILITELLKFIGKVLLFAIGVAVFFLSVIIGLAKERK